jgi:hypothetical protein
MEKHKFLFESKTDFILTFECIKSTQGFSDTFHTSTDDCVNYYLRALRSQDIFHCLSKHPEPTLYFKFLLKVTMLNNASPNFQFVCEPFENEENFFEFDSSFCTQLIFNFNHETRG